MTWAVVGAFSTDAVDSMPSDGVSHSNTDSRHSSPAAQFVQQNARGGGSAVLAPLRHEPALSVIATCGVALGDGNIEYPLWR